MTTPDAGGYAVHASAPPPPPGSSGLGHSSMRLPIRVTLAILGGVLCALAFPEPGIVWAAPLGVALMTAAWWRASWRQALLSGYLSGLAFNLILLSWIRVLGLDAWLALSVGWSVWWILLGLGTAAATWLRGWWPLAVAGVWVLVEGLRGRLPWGGFPWGRLAFANSDTTLTPWSSLLGSAAVTALVAGIGALLLMIARELYARKLGHAVVAVIVVAVLGTSGLLIPLPTAGEGTPANVTMAVVQGSVPRTGLDVNSQRRAVLDNHVAVTLELAEQVQRGEVPAPQAVIWPENSSDVDPFLDPAARAEIDIAAKAIGVPILVGAVVEASSGDAAQHRHRVGSATGANGHVHQAASRSVRRIFAGTQPADPGDHPVRADPAGFRRRRLLRGTAVGPGTHRGHHLL